MYRDIIERAIEQFAAGLAYVMGLRAKKQEEKAQEYINGELLKYTGLADETLLNFPENLSQEVILKKCDGNDDLQMYLADLLKERAEMFLLHGKTNESRKLFRVSLFLLKSLSAGFLEKKKKDLHKKIRYLEKISR